FTHGLGAVTNQSQEFPWGLWKGFNVVTGVAFAGGAYCLTFVVYVLNVEKYHSIARATVLNGLLSYVFYAGALILDLGRPWYIVNPIIGNSFGYNSVLFLVAWHFLLYMIAQAIEFSPAVAEWIGYKRAKRWLKTLTLGAVIFGITLSLLHQSGLGALFLLAHSKIHPLWYTEFLPLLFVVSSVPAGLSMVILESSLSQRVFRERISDEHRGEMSPIWVGLAKGAAGSLFAYYFFKAIIFIHGNHWALITDGWGALYLIEVMVFVLVPCVMFAYGARQKSFGIIRTASVLTMIGSMLTRLYVSVIAFNWRAANHYIPSWQEIVVAAMIIFVQIWVFRWIVMRMPVFSENHSTLETKGAA
ncbi:MAG: polysulfide reductase NrfD, partial [Myxococcales bacterium]|nr:polysulfide reductase NrfD [Myxococcales bacterium]